jgi:hypothetical protein
VRYAWLVASIRRILKRALPSRALNVYRRRRALRRYLRQISYQLYDRNLTYHLEELEGDLLARRPDITSRLMEDLLMRTDILIQRLDRQVAALRARHSGEFRELHKEVGALRESMDELRAEVQRKGPPPAPEEARRQSPAGRSVAGD